MAVTEATQKPGYAVESRNSEGQSSTVTEATQNQRYEVESCNGWGPKHDESVPCEACDGVAAYQAELRARNEELTRRRAPRFAKYRAEIAQREADRERRRARHRADQGDEAADALEQSEGALAKLLGSRRTDDDDEDRLLCRFSRHLAGEAARTAECCGRCGVELASDAPVWRRRLNFGVNMFGGYSWLVAPVCKDCRDEEGYYLSGDVECRGCGRPVVDQFHEWAPTDFCCERCRWSYGNRQRAVERDARPCDSCGETFTGRPDARFCSNACRQRDYRVRKAAR